MLKLPLIRLIKHLVETEIRLNYVFQEINVCSRTKFLEL